MTSGNKRVLRLLQGGGEFTTIDFVRLANVADPHKQIAALREKGYKIKDEWKKHNGKRFKVWQLGEASATQTEDNNTTNK